MNPKLACHQLIDNHEVQLVFSSLSPSGIAVVAFHALRTRPGVCGGAVCDEMSLANTKLMLNVINDRRHVCVGVSCAGC